MLYEHWNESSSIIKERIITTMKVVVANSSGLIFDLFVARFSFISIQVFLIIHKDLRHMAKMMM